MKKMSIQAMSIQAMSIQAMYGIVEDYLLKAIDNGFNLTTESIDNGIEHLSSGWDVTLKETTKLTLIKTAKYDFGIK